MGPAPDAPREAGSAGASPRHVRLLVRCSSQGGPWPARLAAWAAPSRGIGRAFGARAQVEPPAAPPPLKSAWAQIVRGPGTAEQAGGGAASGQAAGADARRQAPAAEAGHNIRADYPKPAAVRVPAATRDEPGGRAGSSDGLSGAASVASPRGVVPTSGPAASAETAASEPPATRKEREASPAEGSADARASTPKHEVGRPCHPVLRPAVLLPARSHTVLTPTASACRTPRRPSP